MKLPARSRRAFIVRAGETRPAPVIGNPYPASSPLPTGADLENVKRFLELRQPKDHTPPYQGVAGEEETKHHG